MAFVFIFSEEESIIISTLTEELSILHRLVKINISSNLLVTLVAKV